MSCGQQPFASKQTRTKYAFERRYSDRFTLCRRPQIEACSSNTYHGLLQKCKWVIVNSRFLERPQKRSRRNQLIRRRLIKTKIDTPIQIGYEAWSGGRLLGPLAEMAFVQLVGLRLGVQYKFHRHTYIGRTSHLGKIQGGRPPLHTLARTLARRHAVSLLPRTHTLSPCFHARTHADR